MTAPVSPSAVVAASLLRAVGVQSRGEARAVLREHVTYTLPRMSAAAILEVLDSFDDGTVPDQRSGQQYDRPAEPGTQGTGRPWSGARDNLDPGETP